ncbi:MAG: methylmalonyl-CoA mutase family protein [Bacteroidota bacterium]
MSDKDFYMGFEPLSKDHWISIAMKDLKGADFDEKLVWKTYEDFTVQPYYSHEDLGEIQIQNPVGSTDWISYWEIDGNDEILANQEAHSAVSFDAGGLLFRVDQKISIEKLMEGIDPTSMQISFSGSQAIQATKDYIEYLSTGGASLKEISGFCDYDVIGQWITVDGVLNFKEIAELIKMTDGAPHFKVIHIHSGDFVNAGSNFTQELAFTLNKMVDYIDQLTEVGLTAEETINNLSFELAITGDFFFEMAKIRSMRALLGTVLRAYNINNHEIPILGSSSLWSKSKHDYHINMIRDTTEAMSAILGGCDGVMIKAHNSYYETPTVFGKRIANNISNLLREESFFNKVDNPVSGSYYLESITNQLTTSALELFKKIEQEGGLIESTKKGEIQNKISRTCKRKEQDLLEGKTNIVGTNKYTIEGERIEIRNDKMREKSADGRQLLFPRSLANVIDNKDSNFNI